MRISNAELESVLVHDRRELLRELAAPSTGVPVRHRLGRLLVRAGLRLAPELAHAHRPRSAPAH